MTGHSYVGSTPSVAAAQHPQGAQDDRAERRPGVDVPPPVPGGRAVHAPVDRGPVVVQLPDACRRPAACRRGARPGAPRPATTSATTRRRPAAALPDSALTAGEDQLSGRYSDWHLERDWNRGATQADIPIFVVHGVNDNAARIGALEWFFERRNPERQAMARASGTTASGCCPNRRGIQWTYALHAWFDKQLGEAQS